MSSHKDKEKEKLQPFEVKESFKHKNQTESRRYYITELLGEGGFAKCYKGKRLTDGETFAIKAINLNEPRDTSNSKSKGSQHPPRVSTYQKAIAEARFLKTCKHPNIIRYETSFIHHKTFYIVMEYCRHGSLNDMLKKRKNLTEVQARYYVRQMVLGLIYIKQQRIIHRDLKPANYLLTQNLQLKIADFGLATEVRDNKPVFNNMCGTPNYLSPQMLDRKQYSYQVDVWSVGVALYAMLFGVPPFETQEKNADSTYANIRRCRYSFVHERITVSRQARDLISKILVLNPNRRISLEKILYHPFMSCFEIPTQLPNYFFKFAPQQKFLNWYENKIEGKSYRHQTHRGKSEPSKESEEKGSKHHKQPMRFCPPEEYEKQERKSKSFSYSASFKYEIRLSNKKELLKQKNELKQTKESQRKRPISIGEAMKKLQKEEVLTSSPISSNYSIKSSSILNKYVQYPVQNPVSDPEFAEIKVESFPINSKIFNEKELLEQKQNNNQTKEEGQIIEEPIENEKETIDLFHKIPLPSFKDLMKPLSFDKEFWNNENYHRAINFDHKEFVQSIMKTKTGDKNEFTSHSRSNSKKISLEPVQQKLPNLFLTEQKIYSLEDFLLCTSSLHLTSDKLIKMAYCLKEEKITVQKLTSLITPNHLKSEARFIGAIFFDNSSIITKIHYVGKEVKYSSVYIKNIEKTSQNKGFEIPELIESLPLLDCDNKTDDQNQFAIELDIFNGQKFKLIKQKFVHDIRLKMKLAKDGILLFRKHLKKSFPQLFEKKSMKPTVSQTIPEKEENRINDFIFIQTFRSRKSTLYFELNDGSKHQLEKKESTKKNYLDMFKDSDSISEIKNYQYSMYFSVKKVIYVKKIGEQRFTKLNIDKLKTNESVKIQNVKKYEESQDQQDLEDIRSKKIKTNESVKIQNVKKYEESEDQQDFQDVRSKKIKTNESQPLSSKKLKNQSNVSVLQPNEILTKICHEFKQKLDMFYIRQRDALEAKRQITENRFCDIVVQNGMFDFKMKKINV